MNWVSNKVLTDIRAQLFSKMIRQSMDFFNKMQSGFLMSRITNDTAADADRALQHQQRSLQTAGRDHRRHRVLLYMDWKFTIVTLVLFPSCLIPLSMYGKRARKAVNNEQEGMAEMVVTMQESFRRHSRYQILRARGATGKGLSPQQSIAVFQFDAHFALDGSGQPIGRNNRRHGCRLSPSSTFMFENLPAAKFIALHRRHFSPLRADQNPEPDAHHDAAFHRVDD